MEIALSLALLNSSVIRAFSRKAEIDELALAVH